MIESIVLMTDERTRKSIDAMNAEDAGYILKGLLRHAAGEEIDTSDWPAIAAAVYPLIEGQVDRMTQLRDKNRENGSRGGRPPKTDNKPNNNPGETQQEPDAKQIKAPVPVPVPEHIKESPTEMRKAQPRFVPPTVELVRAYVEEKGLHVDPERFVAFYASKGWMVGKNKMTNWHQAIAGWESRDKPPDNPKSFGRDRIDYDAEISAMMYASGG